MSETDADENQRDECPEANCIQEFRPQEMTAHLRWDHGYSDFRSKRRVQNTHSVYTDTDTDPGEDSDE